jgi:hypothetical protein
MVCCDRVTLDQALHFLLWSSVLHLSGVTFPNMASAPNFAKFIRLKQCVVRCGVFMSDLLTLLMYNGIVLRLPFYTPFIRLTFGESGNPCQYLRLWLVRERDQSGVRLKASFSQSGRPLRAGGSNGGSILCGVSDRASTGVRKESSERGFHWKRRRWLARKKQPVAEKESSIGEGIFLKETPKK